MTAFIICTFAMLALTAAAILWIMRLDRGEKRDKTPPYVQAVLDYVNAHDDWTLGSHTVSRPGGKFSVWIANGVYYCTPVVGIIDDLPFPRRHRRALYKAAMDAAAKTIRNATPVKGSE